MSKFNSLNISNIYNNKIDDRQKPAGASGANGLYARLFFAALARNKNGALRVTLPNGASRLLGDPNSAEPAALDVRDSRFFARAVLFGDIGFGEAYEAGYWDSPDPQAVLRWLVDNHDTTPTFSSSGAGRLFVNALGLVNRLRHASRANTRRQARDNIREHYDLSNEFFALMLDSTMTYSCAVFAHPDEDLAVAQTRKYEMLCAKLALRPGMRVLEIGCGWGGFAEHAVKKHGARVTALTISQAQYDYAAARFAREGIADSVDLRLEDYRDTRGVYDRVVSIEMAEAIGHRYLDALFRQCSRLLTREGIAAIQCITYPDPHFGRYLKNNDWTQKYIFPGSQLLSLREILNSLHRTGDLMLWHADSLGLHYAHTLRRWRAACDLAAERILSLGFDRRFLRRWNYYLHFCEAAFAGRYINDMQIVLARPGNRAAMDFPAAAFADLRDFPLTSSSIRDNPKNPVRL